MACQKHVSDPFCRHVSGKGGSRRASGKGGLQKAASGRPWKAGNPLLENPPFLNRVSGGGVKFLTMVTAMKGTVVWGCVVFVVV